MKGRLFFVNNNEFETKIGCLTDKIISKGMKSAIETMILTVGDEKATIDQKSESVRITNGWVEMCCMGDKELYESFKYRLYFNHGKYILTYGEEISSKEDND